MVDVLSLGEVYRGVRVVVINVGVMVDRLFGESRWVREGNLG